MERMSAGTPPSEIDLLLDSAEDALPVHAGTLDCGKISPNHDCGMDGATANKYYTAGPPHMLEQVTPMPGT